MNQLLRRISASVTKHLSRQGVAWLALFMAATGTSFAAGITATAMGITSTTPLVAASPPAANVSWVKVTGTTGAVADSGGNTFTSRRTTNGTYDVSFSGYSSADCAATATVHSKRMVVAVDEQSTKVVVTAYLSYTNLNFDTDVTVMFACDAAASSTSDADSVAPPAAPGAAWVRVSGSTGAVLDSGGASGFSASRTTNGQYRIDFTGYSPDDCAATATPHSNRMAVGIDTTSSRYLVINTYLSYTNLNFDSDVTVMFSCV